MTAWTLLVAGSTTKTRRTPGLDDEQLLEDEHEARRSTTARNESAAVQT